VTTKLCSAPFYHLNQQNPHVFNPLVEIPKDFCLATSSSFDHIASQKDDRPLEIYTRLLVKIDEVVTEDVVGGIPLNSAKTGRLMLKFFPVDSVRMMSEINAYQALQSLQGVCRS
jgi:hypothetical protein